MKTSTWIFIFLPKALLKYEKQLKLFKKQTNQTQWEYMAFLSIGMASFHQKKERWKALEGRDKKVWPQQEHSPELRLPLPPQQGAETAAHPAWAFRDFRTWNFFEEQSHAETLTKEQPSVAFESVSLCTETSSCFSMQKYRSEKVQRWETPELSSGPAYAERILFVILRNHQHGEQEERNTLPHIQLPILLMRQINKESFHRSYSTTHAEIARQFPQLSLLSFAD